MVANRIALALALLLFGATAANAQTERTSAMWSCNPTADWRSPRRSAFGCWGRRSGTASIAISRLTTRAPAGPWGSRSITGFVLEDASLDGDAVPTQVSRLENGVPIRIGEPNLLVPPASTPTPSAT